MLAHLKIFIESSATRSVEGGSIGEVVSEQTRPEDNEHVSDEDDGRGRLAEEGGGTLDAAGLSEANNAKGGRRKRCEMKDETVEAVQQEEEEEERGEREEGDDERSEGREVKVKHIEGRQGEEEGEGDDGKGEGEEEDEEEDGERARSCMGKRVR